MWEEGEVGSGKRVSLSKKHMAAAVLGSRKASVGTKPIFCGLVWYNRMINRLSSLVPRPVRV